MTLRTLFSTAALALALAGPVHADCAFSTEAEVRISSAAFEAWKAVNGAMQECGPNIQVEMSQEVAEKQPAGFAAQPSLYHIGGVFNSSLVPLVNAGSVRPLDDLVEKYGENLRPNQLITIDGQVMAIAMMVNAQHLMVRQDILDDLGLAVPTTYEELLEAAAVIAEADVVDYPFGAPWKTTWLAFVELYLGYGGAVFAEDGVTPALANETGMKTLDLMARIAEVMDPEYLVADATYVQQQLQQGRIAMAHQWASRAGALEDESESTVAGKMTMAAAPAPEAGMIPASSLWWDGIVIAQNVPDEEAEIAFQVAMEGLDADMVADNSSAAIWIIPGYEPGDLAAGAAATAANGALPFPASTQMGLMQTAIANNITEFLTGQTTAEETLAAMEADYIISAQEAGILE